MQSAVILARINFTYYFYVSAKALKICGQLASDVASIFVDSQPEPGLLDLNHHNELERNQKAEKSHRKQWRKNRDELFLD